MNGFTRGQQIRYVGITGRADGPTGRVIRAYKSGVRVRWADGRVDVVHPQDITAVS